MYSFSQERSVNEFYFGILLHVHCLVLIKYQTKLVNILLCNFDIHLCSPELKASVIKLAFLIENVHCLMLSLFY